MHDVDVVVVGAGLAGLSAARKLVEAGRTVAVLEARDRGAGCTLGGFLSNGVPVEMGGQWVGPTQELVLELITELGLKTFPTYDEGDALTVFDGNVVRYADETFGLPPESAMEVGRLWEDLEILASTVAIKAPWETDGAEDLDRQTVDGWLTANTENSIALRFFRLVVPVLFSAESPELSLLHFLFYLKSGTSLEALMTITGGAQESRVVGGTHQISERMSAELGDSVRLNTVVRTIRQDETGVLVDAAGPPTRSSRNSPCRTRARRNSSAKPGGRPWQLPPQTVPATTRTSLSRFRKTGRSELPLVESAVYAMV